MFVDAGESNPALSLLKNALPLSYAPVPVFPGCQYQKQIIVCLPPGGNILNLILPCSCLPDHCKRQGLPLSIGLRLPV